MEREQLRKLRQKMKEAGISVYVIPSSDCHESEYVCAHYRAREYITGFTGSAGTAVVTLTDAGLWTDGRYFIQAERQLAGSGIRLFRMGEPGVPEPGWTRADVLDLTDVPWELPGRRAWRKQPEEKARN